MERGFIDGEYQDGEIRGVGFLAGQRGMGKTTLMGDLFSKCSGGTLFFDSLSKHEAVLPGYKLFTEPGPVKDYLRINRERRFRILYQPRSGDIDRHADSVCVIVRAFGSMVFGLDEIDMLCGSRWGPSWMSPGLYHLVNYGRHSKVAMLATARRPMNVPRGYTSQCLEMRLFGMREQADLKYFEEYIGKDDAGRIRNLQKYQYLHWTGDGPAALKGGRR
jgi:hypothetical protein